MAAIATVVILSMFACIEVTARGEKEKFRRIVRDHGMLYVDRTAESRAIHDLYQKLERDR